MTTTPVSIIRQDGSLEELGRWRGDDKVLELDRPGFPFLGPGAHPIEGGLPWIFWDMCPSGFIGSRFAREFPELRLPERPHLWSAPECLRALSLRGEDLSGNLIIGEESRRRFEKVLVPERRSGARKTRSLQLAIDAWLAPDSHGASSSLGGQRPKVALHQVGTPNPRDALLKYSPPLDSLLGARWKNLLLFEALCGETLRKHGVSAAAQRESFSTLPGGRRAGLLVYRFDRPSELGRRGAATLSWLAASRGQAELSAPEVLRSLHADGLVTEEAVRAVELVHGFSAAIGNNDAHLGNYGLTFDERGVAALAPIYDVSPMIFAPRADELPDALVAPRTAAPPPAVVPLVETLVALARAEEELDPDFLQLWLRHLGR